MIDGDELVYVEGLTKDAPLMHLMSTRKLQGTDFDMATVCGEKVRFRNAKDAVMPYKHAWCFSKMCDACG